MWLFPENTDCPAAFSSDGYFLSHVPRGLEFIRCHSWFSFSLSDHSCCFLKTTQLWLSCHQTISLTSPCCCYLLISELFFSFHPPQHTSLPTPSCKISIHGSLSLSYFNLDFNILVDDSSNLGFFVSWPLFPQSHSPPHLSYWRSCQTLDFINRNSIIPL